MKGKSVKTLSRKRFRPALLALVFWLCAGSLVSGIAQEEATPVLPTGIQIKLDPASSPKDVSQSLRIVMLLTALSLAPSALIMMTSFTRILIVLGILRQAMGLQNVPPGQILAGMALFLTIFTMSPVWERINTTAIKPYMAEEITQDEAWKRGLEPIQAFMLKQTGDKELSLFIEISRIVPPKARTDVPFNILIPAFMTSELKTALQMSFLIYLPFLVIDLVVASSLMAMGMMMLPPMMISLPVKILVFVLADGWVLCMRGLVMSFRL